MKTKILADSQICFSLTLIKQPSATANILTNLFLVFGLLLMRKVNIETWTKVVKKSICNVKTLQFVKVKKGSSDL